MEQDKITVPFAEELPTGIQRVDAAAPYAATIYTSGGVDADIAIIDSGIDLDHPDRTGRQPPGSAAVAAPRPALRPRRSVTGTVPVTIADIRGQ